MTSATENEQKNEVKVFKMGIHPSLFKKKTKNKEMIAKVYFYKSGSNCQLNPI